MVKRKPSLLEIAKKLPAKKAGQRSWLEALDAKQRKEYLELLEWLKSLNHYDRPDQAELLKLIQDHIGIAPSVRLLRNHLRGE